MIKKMIFAVVPMMLLATVAMAEDSLLKGLDLGDIQDAEISIDAASLDVDFDKLADNVDGDEAIEACFRSFGYGYGGYGYGGYGYGYGGYGYGCYRPCYNYCYNSYYCYRPVVYYNTCYTPCYTSYWGCY